MLTRIMDGPAALLRVVTPVANKGGDPRRASRPPAGTSLVPAGLSRDRCHAAGGDYIAGAAALCDSSTAKPDSPSGRYWNSQASHA